VAGEPDVFDMVDAILAAIPAGLGADSTGAAVAIAKDAARARPRTYVPNTLYLYPDDEDHRGYESGPGIRQDFRLVLDVTVDDQGEHAAGVRYSAVTELLRGLVKAYAEWVRSNQATATHDHLRVAAVRWLDIQGIDLRGVRVRLEGYRLWG
jgi:hypothetical protein